MNSGLSAIKTWSRKGFDKVRETINSCYVWCCLTYILDSKLQKYGVKITKWDTSI